MVQTCCGKKAGSVSRDRIAAARAVIASRLCRTSRLVLKFLFLLDLSSCRCLEVLLPKRIVEVERRCYQSEKENIVLKFIILIGQFVYTEMFINFALTISTFSNQNRLA